MKIYYNKKPSITSIKRIFILLRICFIFFIFSGCAIFNKKPIFEKAFIDLSDFNLIENDIYSLKGEWEFYWNQFLSSENFENDPRVQMTGYFEIPSKWNSYKIDNQEIGADGFATFRTKIKVQDELRVLCLSVKSLQIPYKIFADDVLVLENGIAGKTKETSKAGRSSEIGCFNVEKNSFFIILQISNFYHPKGGPLIDIALSGAYSAVRQHSIMQGLDLFLMGGILIMFMYHLGLYVLRKKDKSAVYFSMFCGLMFFRTLILGEVFVQKLFENIDWEFIMKVEYFTFYAMLPVVTMFFKEIFPDEIPVWLVKISKICFGVCLPLLLFPAKIFTRTMLLYDFFYICCSIIGIYSMYRALKNKRTGAGILLIGFLILFMTMINDILDASQMINTIELTSLGTFIFIFFQAFLLSKKFSYAFNEAEELNISLSEVTDELIEKSGKLKDAYAENLKFLEIEKEIEIASLVQKKIFVHQKTLDKIAEFDIDIQYHPMNKKVGGDYYNINHPQNERLSVILADAIGHGILAALSTMRIDIMSKQMSFEKKPHENFEIMNKLIYEKKFSSDAWFSAFLCDYDQGDLIYSSAGHPAQILLKKNKKIELLKTRGTLIGVEKESFFETEKIKFKKDDILILFTDGIYEEYDEKNNQYGEIQFHDFIEKNTEKFLSCESSADIGKIIINEIDSFRAKEFSNDDITLITIRHL